MTNTNIKINQIIPIGYWNFNVKHDCCAICRNLFEQTSSLLHDSSNTTSTTRGMEDMTTIVHGQCSHVFHSYCIQQWLLRRNVCPLCCSEWKVLFTDSV